MFPRSRYENINPFRRGKIPRFRFLLDLQKGSWKKSQTHTRTAKSKHWRKVKLDGELKNAPWEESETDIRLET